MYTIHLHHLEFFAFHGLFEEERILGNKFVVNVDVDFVHTQTITSISETIDYTAIYDIIKNRMLVPKDLIEIVAEDIISDVHQQFPQVKKIKISIHKSNPPVISFKGNVGVSLQKNF